MNLKDFKNELLKDVKFREEYEKKDIKLDIALAVDEARIIRGLTQGELARKMKTKQSAISRVEAGNYLPSLSFLERMAKALETELIAPKFAFLEENKGIAIDEIAQVGIATVQAAKIMKGKEGFSSYSTNAAFEKINL
jgi:ribosome-binding protein aMBF1 (putative translation factor)